MCEDKYSWLYGAKSNPIYIYAPGYISFSAGIKNLHFLCHALNVHGFTAYMVIHGTLYPDIPKTNPDLITPVLDEELRNQHFKNGRVPIVIYPESIPGNPLNAQFVIRWLLNYPGALGGAEDFPEAQRLIAFSESISKTLKPQPSVLFLPPLDPRDITEAQIVNGLGPHRGPAVMYAGKFRMFVGEPKLPKWAALMNPIEIFREGPSKQSREEVLKLLGEASVLFTFENSTIITEAILLGTPVVLIRSKFFNEVIAEKELSMFGSAWEAGPESKAVAAQSLNLAKEFYFAAISKFRSDLLIEVNVWLKEVKGWDYLSPVSLPSETRTVSQHRIQLAMQILKTQGVRSLIRISIGFLRRRYYSRKFRIQ